MNRGPQERAELEGVLQSFYALSSNDQLRAYESIRTYLGHALGREDRVEREIARRAEGLHQLERAAKHLGLSPGEAMTVSEYSRAGRELGLWHQSRIIRTFETWRNAQRALRGERTREGPAQAGARRASSGRKRSHVDYIDAIKLWLASEPPAETQTDYEQFLKSYHQGLADNEAPLPRAAAVKSGLMLTWEAVLSVAKGEVTLSDAIEARRAAAKSAAGRLGIVGTTDAGLLLGVREQRVGVLFAADDAPVAVVSTPVVRGYFVSDVEAFRDGKPLPQRTEGELNQELLWTTDLERILPYNAATIRSMASRREFESIPPPAGQIGRTYYWLKNELPTWKPGPNTLTHKLWRSKLKQGESSG